VSSKERIGARRVKETGNEELCVLSSFTEIDWPIMVLDDAEGGAAG